MGHGGIDFWWSLVGLVEPDGAWWNRLLVEPGGALWIVMKVSVLIVASTTAHFSWNLSWCMEIELPKACLGMHK